MLVAILSALWLAAAPPAAPEHAIKVVVQLDSPELPADSPERHPRTVWRLGPNKARIEGVMNAENGHRIVVVSDSPNLWVADLDAKSGVHTVDPGPDFGASVPLFPEPEVADLEIGDEAAYFQKHGAKSLGLTKMNGQSCERRDIATDSYLLLGCFVPETNHPVAIALKIRDHIYGQNYLEFRTDLTPPSAAFAQPEGIKFMERPHSDVTHATH